MKKLILPLFACFFCIQLQAQNFNPQWANCYTDPANASLYITDMATDKTGNTYIVGYKINSGADYYDTHLFLRKVNNAGAQEWIQYFDTQLDSIDNAKAVSLDKAGNIYVTGTRIDTFCNICTYPSKISDIITLKYNPQGTRLWVNRYSPGYQVRSSPTDIFVTAAGLSIVTGNEIAYNPVTFVWENTAVVQKISTTGATVWIKKITQTIANSACIDKANNVLVAAAYNPDNLYQTAKPYVIKLDQNGNTAWTKVFSEFNKNGQLYYIFTDAQNNVYANGQTDTIAFNNVPRILTLKLQGTTGNIVWSQKEQASSRTLPRIYGNFTIDASGNSYATGEWSAPGNYFQDWITSKYNSDGVKQWTTFFAGALGGDDIPADITTDISGNVYVAGNTYATPNGKYSYALNVYNASGVLKYQHFYRGPNSSYSMPVGVELDRKGNVYVSGGSGGNCTVKYKPVTLAAASSEISNITVAENKNAFTLFPNPVKDVLNVRLHATSTNVSYSIFDGSGKRVVQQNTAAKSNITVNVQSLKAGTYLLQITDGAKTYSSKFIKL